MAVCTPKIIITCVGGGVLTALLLRKLSIFIADRNLKQRFEKKCKEWPKDVVILHGVPRGKLAPNPSPFVLKLETFLRMHKIPYMFESEFPKGDKQKMPWITLNGEHHTDSQLIINFLSEKYQLKSTDAAQDDKAAKAAATMARVMIDEHLFWGLLLWRFVYSKGEELGNIMRVTPAQLAVTKKFMFSKYTEYSWYQGIGRRSQEEVINIMSDDLRALSDFLGSKQFLLGEHPGNDDCAAFGMLAQIIWNDVNSPFTKLIEEQLPNLKEYCFRMRERYWQDWDAVINTQTLE